MIKNREQALDELWNLYSARYGGTSGIWSDIINDDYLKHYLMIENSALISEFVSCDTLFDYIPYINWALTNFSSDEWLNLSNRIKVLEINHA